MDTFSCIDGNTHLVDEIIADALRKLRSDDLLPEDSSALSSIHAPTARSTSIHERIPGLMGYRSYTETSLKSFLSRESKQDAPVGKESSGDSSTSDDPFAGQSNYQGQESMGEFVSGDKLLQEFDRDERRCREDNMFKDNNAVPFECSSIAVSPDKLMEKQVPIPEWATSTRKLEPSSIFEMNESKREDSFAASAGVFSEGESFKTAQIRTSVSHYNPRLPFSLGIIVPGISKVFDLPILPSDVIGTDLKGFIDGKDLNCVRVEKTSSCFRLIFDVPVGAIGKLDVHLEMPPYRMSEFTAICVSPTFTLPLNLVLPPLIDIGVPLSVSFPFPEPLQVEVQSSNLPSGLTSFAITPKSETVYLSLRMNKSDNCIKLRFLHEGAVVSLLETPVEIRPLQISLRVQESPNGNSIEVKNSESFPVECYLHDDLGATLSYPKKYRVPSCQTLRLTESTFKTTAVTNQTAIFHLEVRAPIRFVLTEKCSLTIKCGQALRPTLDRFVWLDSAEKTFSMVDNATNEPAPWSESVLISPCPLIKSFVEVRTDPNDPSKVILKVTKPPSIQVGRLRFYRKDAEGKPRGGAFGFRYPLIVPETPMLTIHSSPVDTISKAYQLPANGKLKVTNGGEHSIYIVTADQRLVLKGKSSAVLRVERPGKLCYGLEPWRQIVKARTELHKRVIEAQTGIEYGPTRFMSSFEDEVNQSNDEALLNKIPNDPLSLQRLYQLFVTTVENIQLIDGNGGATFFIQDRTGICHD